MRIATGIFIFAVGLSIPVLIPSCGIHGTKKSVTQAHLLCSSQMTGRDFQGSAPKMRGDGATVTNESSGLYRVGYGTFTTHWLCEVRVDAEGKVLSQRRL